MAGMDFDEVESGIGGPSGALGIEADDLADLRRREHLYLRFLLGVEHRLRVDPHPGWGELEFAAGLQAAVPDLESELDLVRMHGLGDTGERRYVAIIMQRQ